MKPDFHLFIYTVQIKIATIVEGHTGANDRGNRLELLNDTLLSPAIYCIV